jgi:hypothetical protein
MSDESFVEKLKNVTRKKEEMRKKTLSMNKKKEKQ